MTISKTAKRLPQKRTYKPVQDQINVLIEQIRTWRDDAFHQRLFQSAIFWGEKVIAMSDSREPMDIYQLAQIYYLHHDYRDCKELLSKKMLSYSSLWCKLLAAQCCIQLEQWEETLEILGESSGFQSQQALDVRLSNTQGRGIHVYLFHQIDASLYYLRGIAYLRQGSKEKAKEEFLGALRKDIRCFDALQTLLDNYMLTSNEELELIQNFSFEGIPDFEADFVKSVYVSKLSPSGKADILSQVHTNLLENYHLASSNLVQIGQAQLAILLFDYQQAFTILQG
jgi:anaphase-promoting complex subunit 6